MKVRADAEITLRALAVYPKPTIIAQIIEAHPSAVDKAKNSRSHGAGFSLLAGRGIAISRSRISTSLHARIVSQ